MREHPGEPFRRLPDVNTPRSVAAFTVAVLVAALIAGCGSPSVPGLNLDGTAQDAEFGLRIHADKAEYRTGDAIAIDAWLSYLGQGPDVVVFGPSGLVGFGVKQLDGRLHMEPASDLVCARQVIERATALRAPFAKSGGFTAEDPDAALWRAYFADPALHLPAGHWQITASAEFYTGDGCSGQAHRLDASVTVVVLP